VDMMILAACFSDTVLPKLISAICVSVKLRYILNPKLG
jgi:hypothetical protein